MKSLIKRMAFSFLFLTACLAQQPYLGNILLISNYNHAHYESIPLIRKIYEPFFKRIVFYGPGEHPEVHRCEHHRGFFSYIAIADAMERYPEFDGYLFLHDDCILSPWKLKNIDQKSIWMSDVEWGRGKLKSTFNLASADSWWSIWDTEWGRAALKAVCEELPDDYRRMLEHNWGPKRVYGCFSDLVYIPKFYKEQFIELAHLFAKHNSFLEVALPTIVSCLAPEREWIWLKGHGMERDKRVWETIKFDLYFNHPVKLSVPENRQFIEKAFDFVHKKLAGP